MRAKRYRSWCRTNYKRRKAQGLKSHRYITKQINSTSAWLKTFNTISLEEWQKQYLENCFKIPSTKTKPIIEE